MAHPTAVTVHFVRRIAVVCFALGLSGCVAPPRDASAHASAPDGLENFGEVNGALFRGAQPRESGLASLQRRGVRTIINLRMPSDSWREEEVAAHALGLGYVAVPLHGLSAPTDVQVAEVLALIESLPAPVFIHCEHGADRTGTIVACYRIQHDGWTAERALSEAKSYGFSIFQIGMRHFIRTFSPTRENVLASGMETTRPLVAPVVGRHITKSSG